eukprot:scaffold138722_cov37-Tisochrysis_lutea.AAC.4
MTSVRMTYFLPRKTALPSCSRLAEFDCGKQSTDPATGVTECLHSSLELGSKASPTLDGCPPPSVLGIKNVVVPPSKPSFR